MDAVDHASEKEQADRDKALAISKAKLAKKGNRYCIDCGDEIPEKRREVYPSATRCITCQAEYEERKR